MDVMLFTPPTGMSQSCGSPPVRSLIKWSKWTFGPGASVDFTSSLWVRHRPAPLMGAGTARVEAHTHPFCGVVSFFLISCLEVNSAAAADGCSNDSDFFLHRNRFLNEERVICEAAAAIIFSVSRLRCFSSRQQESEEKQEKKSTVIRRKCFPALGAAEGAAGERKDAFVKPARAPSLRLLLMEAQGILAAAHPQRRRCQRPAFQRPSSDLPATFILLPSGLHPESRRALQTHEQASLTLSAAQG